MLVTSGGGGRVAKGPVRHRKRYLEVSWVYLDERVKRPQTTARKHTVSEDRDFSRRLETDRRIIVASIVV